MDPSARLAEIDQRLAEIDATHAGRQFPEEIRREWNRLNVEREDAEVAIRRQRITAIAASGNPAATERVTGQAPGQVRRGDPWADTGPSVFATDERELRDRALRVVDHYQRRGVLDAAAADRADQVLRHADQGGDTAAYLHAVGNPAYATAFGKMLADPAHGHLRFEPAEVDAVRQVGRAQQRIRNAMSEISGPAGAFAVPLELDPTIMLSSAGALNPVRQLASVDTIGVREWAGVTSDGITAGYVPEATAATDASPTLGQPVIRTQQGRAFVKASLELFADWTRIRTEMARLLDDARQVVDASEFLTGNGTNRPVGILAIGSTNSLTTSQRILSAATNSFAVGDPWLLKDAIPARFQAAAAVAASPGILDKTYRFVGGGSTEPPVLPTRDGAVMGLPKAEWSTMTNGTVTGARVMVAGSFRDGYKIIDRMGASAEIIPHIFDVTNNMPTGERGIYFWWRTGAGVVVPNALRYLEVK
jgi:HK97 family phage major capsid protein